MKNLLSHIFNARTGLLAVTLITASSLMTARADEAGPIRLRDQFLLGMGILAFEPDTARAMQPGDMKIELIGTVTNTFAHSDIITNALIYRLSRSPLDLDFFRDITPGENLFYLDGQAHRSGISLHYQNTPNFQSSITLQWLGFRGGNLDPMIESFHDLFETGQHGRLGIPRDNFMIYLRSGNTEYFEDSAPGEGIGDIVLQAKIRLPSFSNGLYLSVEPAIKLPIADKNTLFSSGSADTGVQLLVTRDFSRFSLHGSMGFLYLGKWPLFGLPAQFLFSASAAYEYLASERSSIIAQFSFSQSPHGKLNIPELSDYSLQMSLGYKHETGKGNSLLFALTENLIHFDNSADVGIHLGYIHEF